MYKRFLIVLLGCLSLFSKGKAQEVLNSIAEVPIIPFNNLVQGRFYDPIYPNIKGTQYLNKSWIEGNVLLLGQEVQNMPLWYDIYADELILLLKSEKGLNLIRMTKEHIQSFKLGKREFINIKLSSLKNYDLKEGFYELILKDKVTFLIKRRLITQNEDAVLSFTRRDQFYLIKDKNLYRIRNKRDLLEILGKNAKKELQSFLKENSINLKKAVDSDWVKIANYFNEKSR